MKPVRCEKYFIYECPSCCWETEPIPEKSVDFLKHWFCLMCGHKFEIEKEDLQKNNKTISAAERDKIIKTVSSLGGKTKKVINDSIDKILKTGKAGKIEDIIKQVIADLY